MFLFLFLIFFVPNSNKATWSGHLLEDLEVVGMAKQSGLGMSKELHNLFFESVTIYFTFVGGVRIYTPYSKSMKIEIFVNNCV